MRLTDDVAIPSGALNVSFQRQPTKSGPHVRSFSLDTISKLIHVGTGTRSIYIPPVHPAHLFRPSFSSQTHPVPLIPLYHPDRTQYPFGLVSHLFRKGIYPLAIYRTSTAPYSRAMPTRLHLPHARWPGFLQFQPEITAAEFCKADEARQEGRRGYGV